MINLNLIKKKKLKPPFFIYNSEIIKRQFLGLKKSLPKNIDIFYSVKSNPNDQVLKYFKNLGSGVEISSGGELDKVLEAGFDVKKIIFTGPGKTEEDLRKAMSKRIFLIMAESINEIKKINQISKELKRKQDILLRINPSLKKNTKAMFLTSGERQKFGIEENQLGEVFRRIKRLKNINILGLHLYAGSNIFSERKIISATEYLFKLVKKIESEYNLYFPIIDIGGGIPVNYSDKPDKFNIKYLLSGLGDLVNKYGYGDRRIILESGRYLVSQAGEYVVEVVDVKENSGEKFVIVNGGMNHLSRAALIRENHLVEVLGKNKSNKKEIVNIVGNLNTPTDFITRTKLPKVRIGDLLVVKNTGAYGLTTGMVLFSTHQPAKEYFY